MPWDHSPDSRRREAGTYGSAEYRRNRDAARRRAGGRCEQCQHPHGRLQCDHIANLAGGQPDHSLSNLRMLCAGPGTCRCHEGKTAREGGGWRQRPDPEPKPRTSW